jgi:hypothetical protein
MWKALAAKECREVGPWALLALVAYLYATLSAVGAPLWPGRGAGQAEIPFLGPSFYFWFVAIGALLAIVLGLRQTVGEAVGGTYQFLLTRPAGRNALHVKLAVGLATCLGVSAVPIVLYAAWAAMPGTHASPFEWSMTVPAWLAWSSLAVVYLGAFLTGLRPARWRGTRVLPLGAAIVTALLIAVGHDVAALSWIGTAGTAALLAATWWVARTRDFS